MKNNRPLSAYKVKKIMRLFCIDVTATQAAEILGINRNTINRYYQGFRRTRDALRRGRGGRKFLRPQPHPGPSWPTQARARNLKAAGVRHLRARGTSLHRDRAGLLSQNPAKSHSRTCLVRERGAYRWLARLRRVG